MVEATQPPTLGYSPDRSFVSVRDTPPDLGTPANFPKDHATGSAAILGPSVGATPTRDPTHDSALIDQHQMLRVNTQPNPLLPTLTLAQTVGSTADNREAHLTFQKQQL